MLTPKVPRQNHVLGARYLPDSSVTVFAVPRAETRSAAQSVPRLLAGRDASSSIYLGSANVN